MADPKEERREYLPASIFLLRRGVEGVGWGREAPRRAGGGGDGAVKLETVTWDQVWKIGWMAPGSYFFIFYKLRHNGSPVHRSIIMEKLNILKSIFSADVSKNKTLLFSTLYPCRTKQ